MLTKEDEADLRVFHGRVLDDLRLVSSTFMAEDARSAQSLFEAKRGLNAMKRATGRRHLGRLEARPPGGPESSTLRLAILHYIDVITHPGLTFAWSAERGFEGLVTGKPAVIVSSSAGGYHQGSGV